MKEGLDKVLVNSEWFIQFLETVVVHAPFLGSNYCPLWIKLENNPFHIQRPEPFKFSAAWLDHENFKELVSGNGSSEQF